MIIARGYQQHILKEAREELRKVPSVLVVLPTGGGKTVIFSLIAKGIMERQKSVLILVHRAELLKQTSKALLKCGVPHGIIASGIPETAAWVQVGMVATVAKRLDRLQQFDLIITDECHHAPAKTYTDILDFFPRAKGLGFTATPERLDGKGLGGLYHSMVLGPSVTELTVDGWLVPSVVYAPPNAADLTKLHSRMGDFIRQEMSDALDMPSITGDVVEHYRKLCPGTAAVAFCVSVAHAEHVADTFSAAGIPATSVDGKLSKEVRDNRIAALANGTIKVLTSCDLISEGFDLPRLETAILLRPTQSLSMYLQQVGRALRPDKDNGKTQAYVLDHVGNCARHGLPDEDRRWDLGGKVSRKKKEEEDEEEIVLKICPDCYAAYRGDRCKVCGSERDSTPREVVQLDGELVKVEGNGRKYVDLSREEWLALRGAKSPEELQAICEANDLDHKWAKKVITSRWSTLEEGLKVQRMMKYSDGWAKHRYIARHGEEAYKEAVEALLKGKVDDQGNTTEEKSA